MKTIHLAAILLFVPVLSAAQPKNFGDRVVECLASMRADKDSPEFDRQISQCERRTQIEIKKDEWHQCIAKETSKLDDKISPASDIALAVSSSCEVEFNAYLDTVTVSQQTKQNLKADRARATQDVAIKIVLLQRAEAATNKSAKKNK